MSKLMVSETFLNASDEDKRYIFGESDWQETRYDENETGDLYRCLQREYGRCTSRVYIDTDKGARAIGWVFVKRMQYEDCSDTYLREVWVSVARSVQTIPRQVIPDYVSL